MPTIRRDGVRLNDNVLARAVAASGHDAATLVRTARVVDDGDRYLNRREIGAAVDALDAKQPYEKLLEMDAPAFQSAGRAELAKKAIPQVAALRFGGKVQASPLARERDRRMDLVAAKLAAQLQAAGFTVGVEGQGALLAGRLPEKWRARPDQGGAWGEAYGVLDMKIPGVGKTTIALLYKREMNEWTDGSGAHAYVQPKAEIMLGFVDDKTRQWHGSGYHYDGDLFAAQGAAVDVAADALADEMASSLLDYQALNDRRRPRRDGGVG